MRKVMAIVAVALVLAMPLRAQENVKVGGLFYLYNFYWNNADFTDSTQDHDSHFYMHADINLTANFSENASAFVRVAAAGNFGSHPIYGAPGDPHASVQEAYLKVKNLFGLPVCLQVGKQRVAYDNGLLLFDGGEEGELGVKAKVSVGPANINLFGYKLIETGGMGYIGTGMGSPGVDESMYGFYANVTPIEMLNLDLFGVMVRNFVHWDASGNPVPTENNNPMWVGFRGTGSISGLDYNLAYIMQMGADKSGDTAINYKGNAIEFTAHYKLPIAFPLKIGGGYVNISGDNSGTPYDYEGYFNPLNGPYAYDNFYDGWVGFGPAFMLNTPYGFDLVGFPPVTDLNVINANLTTGFAGVGIRLDFFKYKHVQANVDCGHEIAVNLYYNLPGGIALGAGVGSWNNPNGDSPMLGSLVYLVRGF